MSRVVVATDDERIAATVRDAGCEAIVNLSCGSAGGRALRDERLGPLELAPEMASFDCGSINFREQLFEEVRPLAPDLHRVTLDERIGVVA